MKFLRRISTSAHRLYYKRFSTTDWKIVRYHGAEFAMLPTNYVDRRMWIEGGYEQEQLSYLLNQAREENFDAFIDIGANFGLYSCVFGVSELVPVIHSFECDPRNLNHLYGHLRMNSLQDRVSVHGLAAGDKAGLISFRMREGKNTGHSHVAESVIGYDVYHSEEKSDQDRIISVEQKAIDDVLDFRGKRLICKIDVEGYEVLVLKGMTELLRNNSCLLQIEIVDDGKRQTEMLAAVGYKNVHQIGADRYFSNIRNNYDAAIGFA
jgi:FkbM family methyltransferase